MSDPYYGVRDSINSQIERVKTKHDLFQKQVLSVNTASNGDFKELRKSLVKEIRNIEKQLKDLKLGAVDMVEANRAKFPQIR